MIEFNRAHSGPEEIEYVRQAFTNGKLCGDGPFTRKVHKYLESATGARRALLTPSCTDALEASAILLNLKAGDEVIMPSFTFVSTANAYVLRGTFPRFVDIRSDTKNIDEKLIEARITPRTRAIVVVHYAGVSCDMDAILDLASSRGLAVIEDNAHGLFGSYKGRPLGSMGAMATLSFHETKNFSCGEGGALLVNDPGLVDRAEIVREKGTDRSRFFRGQVDKYTWVDIGSSFLPSDISAAILLAQLERREQIQNRRKDIWQRYFDGLRDLGHREALRLPTVPSGLESAAHNFYIETRDLPERENLTAYLKAEGISSHSHYVPLHLSRMGREMDPAASCPETERVSDRLLRLPFFYDLTDEQVDRVCESIRDFYAKGGQL